MHSGLAIGVKVDSNSRCSSRPSQPPLPARIATSASPARRSHSSLLVVIRTARSGCSIWNAPSRHASQVLAKVCVVVIVSSDFVFLAMAGECRLDRVERARQRRQQALAERGQPSAALLAHEQRRTRAAPRGF